MFLSLELHACVVFRICVLLDIKDQLILLLGLKIHLKSIDEKDESKMKRMTDCEGGVECK